MKENLKIDFYAPTDGFVDELKNLNDGVFSEKMVGEGFYLKPTNEIYYSPFKNAIIKTIYETKHAFIIHDIDSNIDVLMHIGLDTVNLKGEPFKLFVIEGQKIDLDTPIVEVNLKLIESKKILCETPLIFYNSNGEIKNITLLKLGTNVSRGEKIAEIVISSQKEITNLENNDFINYKGKYAKICDSIYKYVGGKENYKTYYNCVTRMRFDIFDKELVDIEGLKKIPSVKGINWSGNELQIIFGGEVYKVREEYDRLTTQIKKGKYNKKNEVRKSKVENLIWFLKGVIMPVLPALMASGLLMAIQSILQLTGAIETIKPSDKDPITNYSIYAGVFYILSQTTLSIIGVLFCYNTVKLFKGDNVMGIIIGITLASPYLFISKQWTLFTFLDYNINVTAYGNAILVQVLAGLIYVYIDKWIKTWMPTSVDLVFRHALVYLFTIAPIFLGLGPIMGILETFVTYGFVWIGGATFGIGAGIFCMLWQPLVLTGLHHTVMLPIKAEFASGNSSVLLLATSVNCIAQFGATLAIILRTKNSNVRQACITSSPACLLGITEPIMYGVNLPKIWPFIYGCIGAFASGMIAGIMNATPFTLGGSGVLNFLRYINGGITSIIQIAIINLVALMIPFVLTLFLYHERLDEIKSNNKADSLLFRIYSSISGKKFSEVHTWFGQIIKEKNSLVKSNINYFKDYEKEVIKLVKYQTKIRQIQTIIDKKKEYIAIKIAKFLNRETNNDLKINILKEKFISIDDNKNINRYNKLETELITTMAATKQKIELIQKKYLNESNNVIQKMLGEYKLDNIEIIKNIYVNAINSLLINYQFVEKENTKIDWKKFKKSDRIGYFLGKRKLSKIEVSK